MNKLQTQNAKKAIWSTVASLGGKIYPGEGSREGGKVASGVILRKLPCVCLPRKLSNRRLLQFTCCQCWCRYCSCWIVFTVVFGFYLFFVIYIFNQDTIQWKPMLSERNLCILYKTFFIYIRRNIEKEVDDIFFIHIRTKIYSSNTHMPDAETMPRLFSFQLIIILKSWQEWFRNLL